MHSTGDVVCPIQCLRTVDVHRSHIGGGGWVSSTHLTRENGRVCTRTSLLRPATEEWWLSNAQTGPPPGAPPLWPKSGLIAGASPVPARAAPPGLKSTQSSPSSPCALSSRGMGRAAMVSELRKSSSIDLHARRVSPGVCVGRLAMNSSQDHPRRTARGMGVTGVPAGYAASQ
jgi:hypothetical protein